MIQTLMTRCRPRVFDANKTRSLDFKTYEKEI